MAISSEIRDLWQQHTASVFPKEYGKREINRIDLPLLEAEIAGCIRLFVHGAKLDSRQIKTLRSRLIDLNTIVLFLEREDLMYFDQLRRLADLVLQEVDQ